jgi:ubiquinone/menaquinone biosynthesis C-methylase UbiE
MNAETAQQYRDSAKLAARINLHRKYGRGAGLANLADAIEIAPGSAVLEVGCGPGRFWAAAAPRLPAGLAITLTDLSPGMLDEALATVRGLGRWADVRGEVADVCALPFADGAFDVVLAMHMLYHARDADLAVSEIARVLRPGGRAIVTTNGPGNLGALHALNRRAFGEAARFPVDNVFNLETGAPILRRHFASVETTRAVDELRVTDPADVVAYLTSFPPGETADADGLARLQRLTEAAFAAQGGVFPVARDTGYMIARKAAA